MTTITEFETNEARDMATDFDTTTLYEIEIELRKRAGWLAKAASAHSGLADIDKFHALVADSMRFSAAADALSRIREYAG